MTDFLPTPSPSVAPTPSPSDEKPSYYWIIGLSIYITGTITMSAGINLQKYALNKIKFAAANSGQPEKAAYKSPIWFIGLICYITAGILLSSALYFASPALVTPFMSVVLVSNVIFAHFLLGEPFGMKDGTAVLVVIVGLVFTAVGAPIDNAKYTGSELLSLYFHAPFIVFFVIVCVILATLIGLNYTIKEEIKKSQQPSSQLPKWKQIMFPFTYAALAGMFGGMTVLIMKSAIEIIVSKLTEGFLSFIKSPMVYGLLFLMGFFWSMQMFWLNRGLKYFNAIYIVSVEAVINELIAVVGSIIYFQEYDSPDFDPFKKLLFGVGLSIGMLGVLLLAYWRRQTEGEKQPEPNVYDINPEQWLDLDEETERQTYTMTMQFEEQVRKSGRLSYRQASEVYVDHAAEIAPAGEGEGWQGEITPAERDRIIEEAVIYDPNPFTPSPMLSYSFWGVPLTAKMRVARHSGGVVGEGPERSNSNADFDLDIVKERMKREEEEGYHNSYGQITSEPPLYNPPSGLTYSNPPTSESGPSAVSTVHADPQQSVLSSTTLSSSGSAKGIMSPNRSSGGVRGSGGGKSGSYTRIPFDDEKDGGNERE